LVPGQRRPGRFPCPRWLSRRHDNALLDAINSVGDLIGDQSNGKILTDRSHRFRKFLGRNSSRVPERPSPLSDEMSTLSSILEGRPGVDITSEFLALPCGSSSRPVWARPGIESVVRRIPSAESICVCGLVRFAGHP